MHARERERERERDGQPDFEMNGNEEPTEGQKKRECDRKDCVLR